jgi:predicted transcriptional regulator
MTQDEVHTKAIESIAIVCRVNKKSLDSVYLERIQKVFLGFLNGPCQGNKSEAARQLELSQSFVSELFKGTRGHGLNTVIALSDATGKSVDELLGRAKPARSEIRLERDERYPNLANAIFFLGAEVSLDAVERVRREAHFSKNDMSRGEWVDDLRNAEKKIRREHAEPDQVISESEEAQRKASEAAARETKKMQAARKPKKK